MIELTMGNGEVYSAVIQQDGRTGIILKADTVSHPIGENAPDFEITPDNCDVLIWLGHEESARVLQDCVNLAISVLIGQSELKTLEADPKSRVC